MSIAIANRKKTIEPKSLADPCIFSAFPLYEYISAHTKIGSSAYITRK